MKPFNYALLKYFTKHGKSSVYEIMDELKGDYGQFKFFNKKAIEGALLTAEANGLIEEASASLDKDENLVIYYVANEESKRIINSFIED